MKQNKGISQIAVMVIMLVLAIALPITTKLVQKSQENRSKATDAGCVYLQNYIDNSGGGYTQKVAAVNTCMRAPQPVAADNYIPKPVTFNIDATTYTTTNIYQCTSSGQWVISDKTKCTTTNTATCSSTNCAGCTNQSGCVANSGCYWKFVENTNNTVGYCEKKTSTSSTCSSLSNSVCVNSADCAPGGSFAIPVGGFSDCTGDKVCCMKNLGKAYTNSSECKTAGGYCADFPVTLTEGSTCNVVGTNISVSDGKIKTGLCGGDSTVRCCVGVNKSTTLPGVGGSCGAGGVCTKYSTAMAAGTVCSVNGGTNNGKIVTGLCAGDSTIRCCVPDVKTTTCTAATATGSKFCNGNMVYRYCTGSNGDAAYIETCSGNCSSGACVVTSSCKSTTLPWCESGVPYKCVGGVKTKIVTSHTVCSGSTWIGTNSACTTKKGTCITSTAAAGTSCNSGSGKIETGLCLANSSYLNTRCCVPNSVISTPTTKPTATPTVKPIATATIKPTATPTIKPTATPTITPVCTSGTKECTSATAYKTCVGGQWSDAIGCGSATPLCIDGTCQARALADATVNLKIAFAGVKPNNDQCVSNIWSVGMRIVDENGANVLDNDLIGTPTKTNETNAKGEIIYSLSASVADIPEGGVGKLAVFVKGQKHISLKFGVNGQESWYQSYVGQLNLAEGSNSYDFSKFSLLAGDVTGSTSGVPDGKIDARDYSFIKERSQPTTNGTEGVDLVGDIDGNCQVNSGDVFLVKQSLIEINGQTY